MRTKTNKKNQVESSQKEVNVYTEWMTRRQASSYLQVGMSTLDCNIPIRKYYLGKSVRYNKNDLDNFLRSNCKEPKNGGLDVE